MQLLLDPPIARVAPIEPSYKAGRVPDYFKIYSKDPSPWYLDNDIWSKLLFRIARGEGFHSLHNMYALATLHSARRFGSMIKWDMHRGHMLIPDMEFGVWETTEYWDYCKKQYFMKYADIWRHWFTFINE